jgi:hypothetical protein
MKKSGNEISPLYSFFALVTSFSVFLPKSSEIPNDSVVFV